MEHHQSHSAPLDPFVQHDDNEQGEGKIEAFEITDKTISIAMEARLHMQLLHHREL